MKKFLILIFLAVFLISAIPAVSATTYDGTIGQSVGWIQTNFNSPYAGGNAMQQNVIHFRDIEYSTQLKAIIHFDDPNNHASFTDFYGPNGAVTDLFIMNGGNTVGVGQIGYQRLYDNAWPVPNEISGYQYITLDSWNITGLSGNIDLTLSYNHTKVNGWSYNFYGNCGGGGPPTCPSIPSGMGYISDNFFKYSLSGIWTMNQDIHFVNTYHVEKSDATNQFIEGYILKTDGNGRGIVYDGSSGAALTSEGGITGNRFNFTIVQNVTSIIIGSRDASSHFWNSSVLTFGTFPTVTPTPTPIPTPYPTGTPGPYADPTNVTQVPLAPGLTRTVVKATDADTGGSISGLNIAIKDIGANSWHNSTNDLDGIYWIDTIPADTYMAFFTDPTGTYLPTQDDTPQTTGTVAGQILVYTYPMVKTGGGGGGVAGTVQLYIYSREADNHDVAIPNGIITICASNNCNTFSSDIYGNMHINATNNTDVTVTSSKTGYIPASLSFNTGNNASLTKFIYLHKVAATTSPTKTGVIPTKTVVTGNVTPVPTTTPIQYNGFWAPIANGLSTGGAHPDEIGLLLMGIFVFAGFCIGGWSAAPYMSGAPFNQPAAIGGGAFGFVLSCAFGFVPIVWVIIIVFVGIFLFAMYR